MLRSRESASQINRVFGCPDYFGWIISSRSDKSKLPLSKNRILLSHPHRMRAAEVGCGWRMVDAGGEGRTRQRAARGRRRRRTRAAEGGHGRGRHADTGGGGHCGGGRTRAAEGGRGGGQTRVAQGGRGQQRADAVEVEGGGRSRKGVGAEASSHFQRSRSRATYP
jgi:hypothetical protein